jgi:hypothetical protein
MPQAETIYIRLLDEGTDVWRPVHALRIEGNRFRILDSKPEDETWPVESGQFVRCEERTFSDGTVGLVAIDDSLAE